MKQAIFQIGNETIKNEKIETVKSETVKTIINKSNITSNKTIKVVENIYYFN